ncbi:phosphoribosyltransferase [Streptomyces sp. WAC 06725]|uniref:phosphoribosyltransferase n=1 Tax=Streptomyces sp. WAC 06725 TaxID=2203209 RepID=UPI000F740F6A|nr:phosphoribosyltransferase family protein [Streptomyces sp. WAC 06725]RSO47757.1 phosphoribosyltransferase [Streptomyces sp. WAC 06725]
MRFTDRRHAGRSLAEWLRSPDDDTAGAAEAGVWPYGAADPLVLALPRGGVPVAAEVAREFRAPLDVLVARKIGVPGSPETGIGAIVAEEPPVFDRRALQFLGLAEEELAPSVARERAELHRREDLYRRGRPEPGITGRTVLLVDDGLATGLTALAALRHLRRREPAHLTLAAPVGSRNAVGELSEEADRVLVLHQPHHFRAVGEWYDDFGQVSDDEVIALLGTSSSVA